MIGLYFVCKNRLGIEAEPNKQTYKRVLSKYQLSAHSLNIQQYKLHYTPQYVSSSTLLIIRRTNCITTVSGIVTLHKQPYSMRVKSGLQSALHLRTVRLLTEGDDTRGCGDIIGPPDDEHRAA